MKTNLSILLIGLLLTQSSFAQRSRYQWQYLPKMYQCVTELIQNDKSIVENEIFSSENLKPKIDSIFIDVDHVRSASHDPDRSSVSTVEGEIEYLGQLGQQGAFQYLVSSQQKVFIRLSNAQSAYRIDASIQFSDNVLSDPATGSFETSFDCEFFCRSFRFYNVENDVTITGRKNSSCFSW